jgi:hypothetical protein
MLNSSGLQVSRGCWHREVSDLAILLGRLNCHDLEQVRKVCEIIGISRVQRQACCDGRGRDEQIKCAASARFAARRCDGGVHAAVRASYGRIDWERIERRLGSLKSILTTGAFQWISGRVRSDSEFRHGDCRDGKLDRQLAWIDEFQIDHDRGVDKPPRMTFVSHAQRDFGRRRRPSPSEAVGCPREGRP